VRAANSSRLSRTVPNAATGLRSSATRCTTTRSGGVGASSPA
jgi:hypothetical protein